MKPPFWFLFCEDVLEETTLRLGRDPLAGVLRGLVERGGAAAGPLVAGVAGDLVGHQVLAEHALAVDVLLDHVAIAPREIVVEVLQGHERRGAGRRARRRRQAPGPEHVVAVRGIGERVGRRHPGGGRPARERAHRHVLAGQVGGLRRRGNDRKAGLALDLRLGEVVALAGQVLRIDPAADHVLVERLDLLRAGRSGGRGGDERRQSRAGQRSASVPSHVHELPPREPGGPHLRWSRTGHRRSARAIPTHGRSELKPMRKLRRYAARCRRCRCAGVDKRRGLPEPLRSGGCGHAKGAAECRA